MSGGEILLALGTGLSAVSSLTGGLQQAAYARYTAKVAERNAEQERLNAEAEADRVRDRARRLIGTSRAVTAAQGGDPFDGSALTASEDIAAQGELDALDRLFYGEQAATRYRLDAAAARIYGRNALTGGILGAGGSILGGLDKWWSRRTPNTPNGTGGRAPASLPLLD